MYFNIVLDTQTHYRYEARQTCATSKASKLCTWEKVDAQIGLTDSLHICDGNFTEFTTLCQDN